MLPDRAKRPGLFDLVPLLKKKACTLLKSARHFTKRGNANMMSKLIVSRMNKLEGKNGTMAICDISINGEFTINGITLNKSSKDGSLFLGFPSKIVKRKDADSKTDAKEYVNITHPITAEARKELTDLVIEEWNRKYSNGGDEQH